MFRRTVLSLLVLAMGATPVFAQWQRRADVQGDITDVVVAQWDGAEGEVFVSTRGAGVWNSRDGECWSERNAGLDDLEIVALAARPGYVGWLKAGTASGRVFQSTDGGASWTPGDVGLGLFNTPFVINDIAVCDDAITGLTYTYVATTGSGVLRQDGWSGSWMRYSAAQGIQNPNVVSIAAVSAGVGGRHKAIAGTKPAVGASPLSHLYVLDDPGDNVWQVASLSPSPGNVTFTSIAFPQIGFAVVGTSRDDQGVAQGLYYSQGITGSWSRVCARLPEQPILSVDSFGTASPRLIVAGTPEGIWAVDDPLACSPPTHVDFSNYRGAVRALAIGDADSGWLGGPGKGPARFRPSAPGQSVMVVRCGLQDTNVIDIAPSPAFSSGDKTVFAASGIAGAYKNVDTISACSSEDGYFYRMIGAPDSWGTVPTNTIRPVPDYDEDECEPRRTVFAATDGWGLLRSKDGGRSWHSASGVGGELAGATITDVVFNPSWNGTTNRRMYAAAYGLGVFGSTDGGDTWVPLGFQPIGNLRVNSLAAARNSADPTKPHLVAGCRALNTAGAQYGLFRYDWLEGIWLPLEGSFLRSITVVRLHPDFDATGVVLIGTESTGVWYSSNGGGSFSPRNTNLPVGSRVNDLELSPSFDADGLALIALAPTNVPGSGGPWVGVGSAFDWKPLPDGLPSLDVRSVAFSPIVSGGGTIFAGHAKSGLFVSRIVGDSQSCKWNSGGGFFNVPPNVLGVAPVPDDPSTVFAVTRSDGVFLSRDGGDTFRPWGANLSSGGGASPTCPVDETRSIAVTQTLGYAYGSFVDFSVGIPSNWTVVNGGGPCSGTWTTSNLGSRTIPPPLSAPVAILDSDQQGSGCSQDDWLISPVSDTSAASLLELSFDHFFQLYSGAPVEHGYLKVRSSATGGAWVTVTDYNSATFGPEHVRVDLTAWKGTSFQFAFHYTGAWDFWWMVDNVWLYRPVNRVVVGSRDQGLFWADANRGTYFGQFNRSNVTTGTSGEVRYLGLLEDMRAAHSSLGDLASSNFGATWTQPAGLPAGLGLEDVSPGAGGGPILPASIIIWGVSSGKSVSLTEAPEPAACSGTGRAWKYDPGLAAWSGCSTSGLDVCEDYRSILQLSSGSLLLGSAGNGAGSSWVGLRRSDATCATWQPSNEGLPANAIVTALYENPTVSDRFVLAAVQDSDLGDGDQGGVYYSDASSAGRAWSRTTLSSSSPGGYELAGTSDGATIYAGLADDGLFSTLPQSIAVQKPTALFTASASQVCVGTSPTLTFSDASAGKIVSRQWDFGDGGWCATGSGTNPCLPNDVSPSHTYGSVASGFTVVLTVTNGYGPSPTDTYQLEVAAIPELDLDNDLSVTEGGAPGSVTLAWSDLNAGEAGYQVWASSSPGSGATLGAPLGPDVESSTFVPGAGVTFFRVQALGAGHVCGDGPVGGDW